MSAPDKVPSALDELRRIDPDAFQRITVAAFAVLAGGPVPCPACDVVAIDADAWGVHIDTVHLGAAS